MKRLPGSLDPPREGDKLLDMPRLVDENLPKLYAYAFRLTGSSVDAEDLTQQTFLIAQQKIQQLRQSNRVQPWLMRILRNCFLKDLRQRNPKVASQVDLDMNEVLAESSTDSSWDQEKLQSALDTLPEEFRAVVLMFYFENLSYKQIAADLQIPIGTVMSRLARAKTHLREKVKRTNQPIHSER